MTSASSSCSRTRTIAMRSTSPVDRVDLGDAVELGDLLRDLGDAVDVGGDEDDGGDHAAACPSDAARRLEQPGRPAPRRVGVTSGRAVDRPAAR